MAEGVRTSMFLILFLSEGVLERPFVQFELSPVQPPQRSGGGTTKSTEEALEEPWRLCVQTAAFQKGFRTLTIAKHVTSRREPNPQVKALRRA